MKKYAVIFVLAVALVFAMSGVAYANFGPHGGYSGDTDSCAGCHRAHTSFSPIQRTEYLNGTPTGNSIGSALLVSSAQTMTEFCFVCHGDDAPGAATNVEAGLFDAGPSTASAAAADGISTLYVTNSSFEATLNGGGFSAMGLSGASVTSVHSMTGYDSANTTTGSVAPMWGFGNSVTAASGVLTDFSCTGCHDPHGSSNYRLLKDSLPGGTVGGYNSGTGLPDPFVVSAEEGYPTLGWRKHEDGALEMASYIPNYTTEEYRNNGLIAENMSGWCAGCHVQYNQENTSYDYEGYMADLDGTPEVGARQYHRHPVNRPVAAFPNSSLAVEPVRSDVLPLEVSMAAAERQSWDLGDMIGCLTCHRAHGTTAAMSGWAESSISTASASAVTSWTVTLDNGSGGVNPNKSSALLRADNRGVCERCHNK